MKLRPGKIRCLKLHAAWYFLKFSWIWLTQQTIYQEKVFKKKNLPHPVTILIYSTFLPLICTLKSLKTNSSYGTEAHLHYASGIFWQKLCLFPKNMSHISLKKQAVIESVIQIVLNVREVLFSLFFKIKKAVITDWNKYLFLQSLILTGLGIYNKLSSRKDDAPHNRRVHTETEGLTINIAHNNRIWKIQVYKKTISICSHSRQETLLLLGKFQDIWNISKLVIHMLHKQKYMHGPIKGLKFILSPASKLSHLHLQFFQLLGFTQQLLSTLSKKILISVL